MTTTFFPSGTPSAPGESLTHYKRTLETAVRGGERPTWRVEPGNLGLLSRAVGELAARGAAGIEVVLPAEDVAHDETRIADEGALAPSLRRIREKAPAGFRVDLRLSTGRAYVLPPPSLDISTNDLCGLRCVMCANRVTSRDPETMTPAEVRALIDEAAAWGVRRVALTGAGEPFRDPEMLNHMEHAHRHGLLVTVTTNGFPMSEVVAERIAAMHASISVSIHGAKDETDDAITGVPSSGEHAWRAIARLVAARDRADARGRFFVSVSSVIQRANVGEIADLVARSRDAGCDGHNLQPVNLQHGSIHDGIAIRRDDEERVSALWPTPEQAPALDAEFDRLVAFRRAYGHINTTEDRLRLFRRYFSDSSRSALGVACRVGEFFLGIDHRGRVKPCYRLPWNLGDARLRSVRALWNSAAYADVRRTVDGCPLTCMNNCFFRK